MFRETHHSVTQWIAELKSGDAEAARQLVDRYWERLKSLAKVKLGTYPLRVSDEEDVVISVLDSLCHGVVTGRFAALSNREDLWWLLIALTKSKAIDHLRLQGAKKRGGDYVPGNSETEQSEADGFLSLDDLLGDVPTPEFLVSLEEEHQRLLMLLRDDTLRRIAIWRMEGYNNKEIAGRLGIGARTVERKLALIRERWELEFAQ